VVQSAKALQDRAFLTLTGGACGSAVEKIAPPVFQTCPPKILLNDRRFIISLNF